MCKRIFALLLLACVALVAGGCRQTQPDPAEGPPEPEAARTLTGP